MGNGAIQNKLESIFANNDATMREALGSGSNTLYQVLIQAS